MKYTIEARRIEKKQNAEGLAPIKIIVTIASKRAHITTGVRVLEHQWDGDKVVGHRLAMHYNALIRSKQDEIEQKILNKLTIKEPLSINLVTERKNYKLVPYFEQLKEELTSKLSPGTIGIYHSEIERLKEFDPGISFSQIDSAWLRRYEDWIRKGEGEDREAISSNTANKCFKVLRTVFNHAIRDKVTSNYPFKEYKLPEYRAPDIRYLTWDEVMSFEKCLLKPIDETLLRVGHYFLISCYAGYRISDLQRFNNEFIQGDLIVLYAKKNGKLTTMPIHDKLKILLESIDNTRLNLSEQKFNKYLKVLAGFAGIQKDISAHWGRHSFAVHCAEVGMSKETTAELMGISLRMVDVYYKITGIKVKSEMKKWDEL